MLVRGRTARGRSAAARSQRWLNLGIPHAATVRIDEAHHRARRLPAVFSIGCRPSKLYGPSTPIWPPLVLMGFPSARWCCMQPDLGTTHHDHRRRGRGRCSWPACRCGCSSARDWRCHRSDRRRSPISSYYAGLSARPRHHLFRPRKPIPWAPAIISASRRSPSGRAALWGKGFLNGTQSHLDYLPEGHTDFVFATMAEEWGLDGRAGHPDRVSAGCCLVGGFRVALRAQRTRYGKLVASGADDHHILLRRDQPDDGDGAGSRWSVFPLPLSSAMGRLLHAHHHDLHRPDYGGRPQARPPTAAHSASAGDLSLVAARGGA